MILCSRAVVCVAKTVNMCPLQINGPTAVRNAGLATEAENGLAEKHKRSLVTRSHVCQVTVLVNFRLAYDADLRHTYTVIPGNTATHNNNIFENSVE